MKIFVSVLCYDRPRILAASASTIMANASQYDSHVLFTDDGRNPEVARVLRHTQILAEGKVPTCPVFILSKSHSLGMVHSSKIQLAAVRSFNPQYWFIHESDYIFTHDCYRTVLDVFENTKQGQMCLGIVGYDHPNFYEPKFRDHIFPECMKAQVGEDNVNRAALHNPADARGGDGLRIRCGDGEPVMIELASNTCPTSYLNWHRIMEIGELFPEIHDLLDQAVDPRDNPNYPTSSDYRRLQMFDDGMLSHAISLVWNRWAIKHGVDRNKFGAWLNIKPSVANAITGGGIHSSDCPEGATTGGSPTWKR